MNSYISRNIGSSRIAESLQICIYLRQGGGSWNLASWETVF